MQEMIFSAESHVLFKVLFIQNSVSVSVVKTSNLEWRQMRGRIYSKFHGRKMSELSPVGLHNATSLFLTLASTTDIVDVVGRIGKI